MSAITTSSYQTIANLYNDARASIVGISTYYYDAAYEIVTMSEMDPELDLLRPFYDAYTASLLIFQTTPVGIIQAVAALQSHVLSKARTDPGTFPAVGAVAYNNIDSWLAGTYGRQNDIDTPITVPEYFAQISAEAGYPIDESHVV